VLQRTIEQDIARRAFDAVAAMDRADDLDQLDALFQEFIRRLGFEQYATIDVHDPRRSPRVEVLRARSLEAWEAHYQGRGHAAHDAVLRKAMSTSNPIFWGDVRTGAEPLTPEAVRIFDEASDFGLREGFVTPIHNLDGSISTVLLSGGDADPLCRDTRTAAHLACLYYAARVRRDRRAVASRPALSPRQLECLKWTREGKSAADIAEILGLSRYTVQEHLGQACARLGVRTRVQALAQAYLLGLLND
jgi:LuxR family transcriptional regulator, quorum-sensing system regulator BjaR1